MNIGERIRKARLAKGMTQEELGQLLGVEKSAVAKYENGRIINLKQKTLKRLSEILEIPVAELIAGNETEQDGCKKNPTSVSHSIFAENLRLYVKRSGKTQSEIAEMIGVPIMTFNDWVRGKTYPRIDKMELLARFFQVSKSELIEKRQESEEERQKIDSRSIFPANLRMLMAKAGKSRKEVSEAIGVSYSTLSDWCNGKKYPRIEKLETLAKHFGVSVSELVGEQQAVSTKTEPEKNSKDAVLDIVIRLHTDKEFLKIVEKMSTLDSEKIKALKQFLLAFGE